MEVAEGDFFLFVDSDCILPPDWLQKISENLKNNPVDCFGGPDRAADEFNDVQKAISFAMTSFLTTGGIRGGNKQLDKFHPRSFNLGISRKLYTEMGGFRIHSERSIIMSYRDCGVIGFDYNAGKEWERRLDDINAFQVFVQKPIDKALLMALAKYNIDYVVFMHYLKPKTDTPAFKSIYENTVFSLYKVNKNITKNGINRN